MKRLVHVLLFAGALVCPASARADGRVVVGWTPSERAVAKSATTPDQRALLVWDEGRETLVIETAFRGAGRDFAWIVPLPSAPTIEASTTGLFPTLEAIAAPEIVHDVPPYWICCLLLGGGVWMTSRKSKELQVLGVLTALVGGAALAYVADGSPNLPASDPWHRKSVLTLGDGAGSSAEKATVHVLDRRVVGTFETATISSSDPQALLGWLTTNGYAPQPEIAPVVAQYVAEGWVFVAAKVKREADSIDAVRIHPLAFTFDATKPVYPMRLTGPGNGDCRVELFVAGARRAQCDGFDVDWCGAIPSRDGWGVAPHAEMRRCIGAARTVTQLSRTYDEASMTRDAEVAWDNGHFVRRTRFSTYGAAVIAANVGAGVALLFAAILWSLDVGTRRGQRVRPLSRWSRWSWAWLAGLASLATWFALARVPVHVLPATGHHDARFELPTSIDGKPPTAASAHAWAADHARAMTNAFTGDDVREEDSPGNYVVSHVRGRQQITWFGAQGEDYFATYGR